MTVLFVCSFYVDSYSLYISLNLNRFTPVYHEFEPACYPVMAASLLKYDRIAKCGSLNCKRMVEDVAAAHWVSYLVTRNTQTRFELAETYAFSYRSNP